MRARRGWAAGGGRSATPLPGDPDRAALRPPRRAAGRRPRPRGTPTPFDPVERDGRLYGRGAADDKAGVAVHCAACARSGRLDIGVTVLVEGEEEIGSPTLPALLGRAPRPPRGRRAGAGRLHELAHRRACTDHLSARRGERGRRGGDARARVHSGVYGGAVPDALTALARLLATLHDAHGRRGGGGADAGRRRAARPDRGAAARRRRRARRGPLIGSGLADLAAVAAVRPSRWSASTHPPSTRPAWCWSDRTRAARPADRAWGRPAAARDALVRHLEAHAPWGARVKVTAGRPWRPYAATTTGPAYAAARPAFAEAWGTAPVEIGVGGSIGFVGMFADAFPDAEVLITGVEDPDTRAHAAEREPAPRGLREAPAWRRRCCSAARLA